MTATITTKDILIENVTKAYFELAETNVFEGAFDITNLQATVETLFDSLDESHREIIARYAAGEVDDRDEDVRKMERFEKAVLYVVFYSRRLGKFSKVDVVGENMSDMLDTVLRLSSFASHVKGVNLFAH